VSSQILRGQTSHCRYLPRPHLFQYRMAWLSFDISELATLNQTVAWFGYNRHSLFSINDKDYAGPGPGSIDDKIRRMLNCNGVHQPIARIQLITLPKVLGYVFNPVSFYCSYQADGSLAALVAEVRNTFGETHHYVLQPQSCHAIEPIRFQVPKAFYVSPFFKVDGDYELQLTETPDSIALAIHLRQHNQLVFSADICGRATPLTTRSLTAAMLQLPLIVATVMLRIHWQAIQLFLGKRLPIFARPEPSNAATIPASGLSVWTRIRTFVVRLLSDQAENQREIVPKLATSKGRS
jgi:DUF1365 family protein